MNKYCIALGLFFIMNPVESQLPELQWAKVFNSQNQYNYIDYSNGRSVAVDHQGNVYSAGLFNHTVDFDPGPGVFTLSASGTGETGIYISKLNSAGNFVWAIQIPELVEFGNIEIKVDNSDNILLASDLRHPADMDPGPGVYMLTPIGAKDAFIVKYNSNGNLIWAKQFGGPGDTVPNADGLDIDANNNVIICGGFNNVVDFDPGPNIFNLTSTAHIQSYVAKLSSNGDFIWAKQLGNSPVVYCGASIGDVKCDLQGNVYTVGTFRCICDFDPGAGIYTLQGQSLRDGFISKLDNNGNFVWAKRIGNTTNDYYHFADSRGIDIDANNNVYTAGNFTGTFDFDPGVNTHTVTSSGNYDWYVLKLNEQGDFMWADIFGGSEGDIGADVTVDNNNNVYAIGTIGHVADMDPGPGIHNITTTNIYGASAIAKVDPNGNFIYAAPFDGLPNGTSLTRRMVLDTTKNIYITGYVTSTVDFDPGPNVYPLSGSSDESPFVLKLARCTNMTTSTLIINTCNSFVLNNETFDSSGTYIRTIPNSAGCDSVITLHLTINRKFTQQNISICQGQSFFAGGANQTIAGTYKDTLQTSLNCDSIVTTYLTVHPIPLPNLGADRDLCAGTQTVITPGSFTKYLWQDMSTLANITVMTPGLYWVKVSNSFNCNATDSLIIGSILPAPIGFLKKTDSICNYGKLIITPTKTYNNYLWSTGSTENQITIESPGNYWLRAIGSNGCKGTDSIIVFKKECRTGVYIPNAITPNNDGKNDIFKALVFGKIASFKLQVFDRQGQLIFQTTNPDKGWDGRNKGIGYSTAVFVWQCFYQLENLQPQYQKGTVTIIR